MAAILLSKARPHLEEGESEPDFFGSIPALAHVLRASLQGLVVADEEVYAANAVSRHLASVVPGDKDHLDPAATQIRAVAPGDDLDLLGLLVRGAVHLRRAEQANVVVDAPIREVGGTSKEVSRGARTFATEPRSTGLTSAQGDRRQLLASF